jgi:hypothetical protein
MPNDHTGLLNNARMYCRFTAFTGTLNNLSILLCEAATLLPPALYLHLGVANAPAATARCLPCLPHVRSATCLDVYLPRTRPVPATSHFDLQEA